MADVLCTLALPEPFPTRLSAASNLRVLGRIPGHVDLCDELRARPVDVLCPQLSDRIDAAVLDAGGPRLRAVCDYAVGYNNVDVAAATERGVLVTNTPGVLTDATADIAMGLIIAAARRIVEGDMALRAGEFTGWTPEFMLGLELRGAQLGIVGMGRIGEAVARRALAFGMRLATLPRSEGRLGGGLDGAVRFMDLDELLESSDIISIHCPLTEQTRHLIDERALRRMKPTAVLVNTARGPIVDEAALVRALREGWIAAAGLDVYEQEPQLAPGLAECRNAVLAPHLGSATVTTRSAMASLVADNALAVLAGEVPPNCVNPEARR
jgi:glyoxylate reductase